MQANEPCGRRDGLDRRGFLLRAAAATAGLLLPRGARAVGSASQIDIVQIVYPGGDWQPRPTAVRRLAWELHKRTSIDTVLEPGQAKPGTATLAGSPLAYLSGDRSFDPWEAPAVEGLSRFLRLGGTLLVDPAYTADGDEAGFETSVEALLGKVLPSPAVPIAPGHLLFRTFYDLKRAVGRREGPPGLTGYKLDDRLAVIRASHDLGGAWARDNLGNWEFDVAPGGERQRENAFRLGVNIVMYALCHDYKDEQPHRRFDGEGGR